MTGFPARPDHPDLWLLSQVLIDQDAQADSGQGLLEIVGRYLDPESVLYMAAQRALRVMGGQAAAGRVQVTAAWLDGLIAGMAVQHIKATPDPGITDPGTQNPDRRSR
jgi:hypothetical protein